MDGLEGAISVADVVNMETGEVLVEANEPVTSAVLARLVGEGIGRIDIALPGSELIGTVVSQTLRKDMVSSKDEALVEIYRRIRPGDPPTLSGSTHRLTGFRSTARWRASGTTTTFPTGASSRTSGRSTTRSIS
jgi:DNA-directed RNA polymerase subunit beta